MPKASTSARQASHRDQDGKKTKKSKHRGHVYRDAAKARNIRVKETGVKGLVEEVVEPIEAGKPRPLRRAPKYDFNRIERKLFASHFEESKPTSIPIEVPQDYGNPIDFKLDQIIIPASEATAKRMQEAAGDDDDMTDVDESEDAVVVPAGFVEAAEQLGLLSASVHREESEEPLLAPPVQPDEKPQVAEQITRIETPSPSLASAPSPPSPPQLSHVAAQATNSSPYLGSYEPTAPISVPELSQDATWSSAPHYQDSGFWNGYLGSSEPTALASFPEISQEAASASQYQGSAFWSTNTNNACLEASEPINVPISAPGFSQEAAWLSASQYQDSGFWNAYRGASEPSGPISMSQVAFAPGLYQEAVHQNSAFWDMNMNNAHVSQESTFYHGSTSKDVNMEFSDTSLMEPPVHSQPTMWISPPSQPEFQTIYPHFAGVAHYNSNYETHTIDPYYTSMGFQSVQNQSTEGFVQINQAVEPLTAALHFWVSHSENSGASTIIPEITIVPESIEATPTEGDGQRTRENPFPHTICQDDYPRRYWPDVDRTLHPFRHLRRCTNMDMSGGLEKSYIIQPMTRYCHLEKPPVGTEEDLVNRLKSKHRKRRHEDSQKDLVRTNNSEVPSRQRRRYEPDASGVKTLAPAKKRSRKRQRH